MASLPIMNSKFWYGVVFRAVFGTVISTLYKPFAAFVNDTGLVMLFNQSFMEIHHDPCYKCPEFACTSVHKLLETLIHVGRFWVIIMINGYYAEHLVVQLFPGFAILGFVLIKDSYSQFSNITVSQTKMDFRCLDIDEYQRNSPSVTCFDYIYDRHLGDLGSTAVLMLPMFVMTIMLVMQLNPIVVMMMLLFWFPLTIFWDPMLSFHHDKRLTKQWEAERLAYSRGSKVLTLQALLPYMALSFSQRILVKTGFRVHYIVNQLRSSLKCLMQNGARRPHIPTSKETLMLQSSNRNLS